MPMILGPSAEETMYSRPSKINVIETIQKFDPEKSSSSS
jgi:hypothetical protein